MNSTLITGASSGIGEAFARKLAERGHNLLLVARSEDKLINLCNELGRAGSSHAQYFAVDHSLPESPARLFEETVKARSANRFSHQQRRLWIDGRVCHARPGARAEHDRLECTCPGRTDASFLQPMRERKGGTIINVASTAAFQPVPFMTTYAATKAFVLSFSEALWEENRPYGIQVMALCPGVTETNFFEAAHMAQKPPARVSQTPEQVVDTALRALKRGKGHVISGWTNFFMTESERVVPRSLIVRAIGSVMRGASAGKK
jgi:short-subunit dehydrogenase